MIEHTTTHRNYRIAIKYSPALGHTANRKDVTGLWEEITIFNSENQKIWGKTGFIHNPKKHLKGYIQNAEDQACEAIDVFLDE